MVAINLDGSQQCPLYIGHTEGEISGLESDAQQFTNGVSETTAIITVPFTDLFNRFHSWKMCLGPKLSPYTL